MARLVQRLYHELTKSWEHLVQIDIDQKSFETNPQFIQIVPPGETVVVISFQVRMFQSTGLLTICYPYVSLEPIVGKLSAQNWIDATKKKPQASDRATNIFNVKQVETWLFAELLQSKIKMKDFLKLKVGDVIPSEKKMNLPIDICVGKRKKLIASPGICGKKRAFQVLEIIEETSEEIIND
jgi:flagellar motor switch protein FliM